MPNPTMNTQDAVSANFAECFVTLDGTRYSMLMAKEFEGKASVNTKEVYKDLQENPYVEVSTSSPAYAWIRLSGKAVFADDRAVKEGCMENPIVKGQYQSADNPIFVVFYLEGAKAVLADFSGNPPREYTL